MRFSHIIKRNHKCETPQRAIFISLAVNIESVRGQTTRYSFSVGVMRCMNRHAKTGQWLSQYHTFSTVKQCWALVEKWTRDKTRTYVVVDDSSVTLALLDCFTAQYDRGWICTLAVIECPPLIVRWRKETATILMLDMRNIWPMRSHACLSISSIATHLDTQEKEDLSLAEAHARQHCDTMAAQMTEWMSFLVTNDLGGFSPTAASQAFRTFRHKYMSHEIFIDCNQQALQLARRAFRGGRTECQFVGRSKGRYYLLDARSFYASIMRDMRVPVKLRGYTEHATIQMLGKWSAQRVVVAECTVRTEEPCYAVRDSDRLIFPVGQFHCVLAGDEVVLALQNGHILNVHAVAVYDYSLAFTAYVDAMWDRRSICAAAGDEVGAEQYKLLLASLYGKWGQSGGRWENIGEAEDGEIKAWSEVNYQTSEVTEKRQFGGIIQSRSKDAETYESSPAIAACITANARIQLWEYIKIAGQENVYYTDTDSLLVNSEGAIKLASHIAPDRLGGLQVQGIYRDIHIRGAKNYTFGSRRKQAGVTLGAVTDDNATYVDNQVRSMAAGVGAGDMGQAMSSRVRKTYSGVYDKGIVTESGRVIPFRR